MRSNGRIASVTQREKMLYHQIHPAKLAADIGCEPLSLLLLWRHDAVAGLATHFLPPIIASVLVMRYGRLERLRDSAAGAHLLRRMSRPVEAARAAGDFIMMGGAWFHQPGTIAIGLCVVVAAWFYVLREAEA
jgi:hypothetical protein